MRTHGCRSLAVALVVISALFLLTACGGSSSSSSGDGGHTSEGTPTIVSVTPASVMAGATSLTLTVVGTNFTSGSTVWWNGLAIPTTFVSATQLTASVDGGRLAASMNVVITVVNPGGVTSGGFAFFVNSPIPVVTSIMPSQAQVGSNGFPLSVYGSGFARFSLVRWDGVPIPTTYVSDHELTASISTEKLASVGTADITVRNAPPGGGTTTAFVFTIGTAQSAEGPNHIVSLPMFATGMVWDASRGRIYAGLPATASNGNSVVAINPMTRAMTTPIFVGSDPNLLALSADASHLWVSLDGASAIQRVTLPDITPDVKIDLPPHSSYGPQVALAMQPAPVNPDTLAVVIGTHVVSPPYTGGVAIYDGAVQRPTTVPSFPAMSWLQWGQDDGRLYGQNASDSSFDLYLMNVDGSGVRTQSHYDRVFPDFDSRSYFDRSTGLVYADDGRVFDPSTGVLTGTFNLRDLYIQACVLDPVQPVIFFLGRDQNQEIQNLGYTLRAFDKNTYRLLGTLVIPGATGPARNLIRWGRAGIAFNTVIQRDGDTPAVYFIDGPFVNSSAEPDFTDGTPVGALPVFTSIDTESATVGSSDLVLTISGSDFLAGATAYWNGQPLVTTWLSSTELQAAVPAEKFAQDGSVTISVSNDVSSYAVNSLTFTVLPASSGMIARNLSSLDIAWDPHSSRLYAPVWSADPRYPDSVVAIDPATGSISKVAAVGSDPYIMRISRDGTLGYTGYLTINQATQFHAPALDSMVSWSLGASAYDGPQAAMDIQPAPDSPQTTAISLQLPGWSPANRGLVIFDNTVARPQRPPLHTSYGYLYDTLQWGPTDSALYAANNETTGFDLSILSVDANGANVVRNIGGVLTDFYLMLHFDRGTGYLYCDDGYAISPVTGSHVGRYNGSGLVVPDSSLNRVFILGQTTTQWGSANYTIASFDQAHFTPISSVTIRGLVGTPVAFIRWGASGLALVTYNRNAGPTSGPAGMLYIFDNPTFVSDTQPVQPGVENLKVGLTWQPGRTAISPPAGIKR